MIKDALVDAQHHTANLLDLSPDERYRRFVQTPPEIPVACRSPRLRAISPCPRASRISSAASRAVARLTDLTPDHCGTDAAGRS